VERLSADDQLMLWPDQLWPQEIGAVAVLDGGPLRESDGGLRIDAVRAAISRRLHLVPRFRQLLLVPGRGLGPPLWVDAPSFDIGEHVRVAAVAAPGDDAALLCQVERLNRQRLDRSRPLWEIWFLTGLSDRRIGLFLRMHHAIGDGIAGVATVGALFDEGPDTESPLWTPRPAPTTGQLFADNLRRRARALGHLDAAKTMVTGLRGPASGPPAPHTSLNRTVGPDRRLAVVRARLDELKQAAHTCGGKVNDVLLAAVAGGLRELLRGRGELRDDLSLPVYVPVTLRTGPTANARGNAIAQMVVPLPLGVADPADRLRRIAADTARRKAMSHPALGPMLHSRLVRRALLKMLKRQPVNVTTADVPGPPVPVHVAGAPVLELFPLLPLIGNVPVGVGALSYAGRFDIMVVVDPDACPDLDVFTAAMRTTLVSLVDNASVGPRVWQ
jgi:WS/DGAT/MGAT family acyltransferase